MLIPMQFEEGYATDEPLHLVSSINKNCAHYIEIFSRAIDKVIPPETLENTWVPELHPRSIAILTRL